MPPRRILQMLFHVDQVDPLFVQALAKVVFIEPSDKVRHFAGCLQQFAGGGGGSQGGAHVGRDMRRQALFVSKDYRVPRILVPLADCPDDFVRKNAIPRRHSSQILTKRERGGGKGESVCVRACVKCVCVSVCMCACVCVCTREDPAWCAVPPPSVYLSRVGSKKRQRSLVPQFIRG